MLSPLETGTARSESGTWEESGNLSLARVPDSGGRRAASGKPGNWLTCAEQPGKVPCISYMEGTLSSSARHKRHGQDRNAGEHSHGGRRHSRTSQRKRRAETDPAEVPADPGPHAGQQFAPAEE